MSRRSLPGDMEEMQARARHASLVRAQRGRRAKVFDGIRALADHGELDAATCGEIRALLKDLDKRGKVTV